MNIEKAQTILIPKGRDMKGVLAFLTSAGVETPLPPNDERRCLHVRNRRESDSVC